MGDGDGGWDGMGWGCWDMGGVGEEGGCGGGGGCWGSGKAMWEEGGGWGSLVGMEVELWTEIQQLYEHHCITLTELFRIFGAS